VQTNMLETILFNMSNLICFILGFAVKFYLDLQFNKFSNQVQQILTSDQYVGENQEEIEEIRSDIIVLGEKILENAQSMEPEGDPFNYKLPASVINNLDELYTEYHEYF